MGPAAVRVVAIDDHPVMLLGIRQAAADSGAPLTFVETAASVGALQSGSGEADVALLDLRLNDGSRPKDNVEALLARGFRVLVYTDGGQLAWMADAVMAGALGIVLKHQPVQHLVEAVTTVSTGEPFLSVELAEVLHQSTSLRPQLTDREVEVLALLHQGMVTKQVARKLDLRESTVKEHLKRIRSKYAALGRSVSTRVELVQRAVEDGYVDPNGA
jgi:two-component system nitrate/nitrite response regulator NarL